MDPQMQAVLDQYAAFQAPAPNTLTADAARRGPTLADAVRALPRADGAGAEPEAVGPVRDVAIPGPAGDRPARLYAPRGRGPFPVLVYFHGGGWVIGGLDAYDSSCRALCNAAGCLVVSVHYRQAPEDRYPAAVEDAVGAYTWVLNHAPELGGDPTRVALAGESAGGNLAAVTALVVRENRQPAPLHQLLVYPVTDFAFDTPSYREYAEARPLGAEQMRWFWVNYLPDKERDSYGRQPYASPLRADDLGGLPPATVILAEIDPLRSEGEAYAERLRQAGVPVLVRRFDGVTHEFFGLGAAVDQARQAVELAGQRLREAFAGRVDPAAADRAPGFTSTVPRRPDVDPARVRIGQEVVGSDGKRVGKVKLVREDGFLVERSLKRDVDVPFEAVTATEADQVILKVDADAVGKLGRTTSPRT